MRTYARTLDATGAAPLHIVGYELTPATALRVDAHARNWSRYPIAFAWRVEESSDKTPRTAASDGFPVAGSASALISLHVHTLH